MSDIVMRIGDYSFEWDENKAKVNLKKHGVSFETAIRVFQDAYRIEYFDADHSVEEDRYVTVGIVDGILSVVYTERDNDAIRLISARKANETERRAYRRGGF